MLGNVGPTVLLALGSLIIALGAFLFSGIGLLQSIRSRREGVRAQFEQKKQEARGLLLQAKISNQFSILALSDRAELMSHNPGHWEPEDTRTVDATLKLAMESDLKTGQNIDSLQNSSLESLREQGEDPMVVIERAIGMANDAKLMAEETQVLAERAYASSKEQIDQQIG